MKIRSLFISDCHLGCDHCNAEKILHLISLTECNYLYIVGDFVDGWALKRKFKWKNEYNTILQKILRMSRKGVNVKYLWGNHDDFMEPFNLHSFGNNFLISREAYHETLKGEKIIIIHGDQFDGIISKNKWLQKIGAVLYEYSLILNKIFRFFKFSLSNFLKQKAKEAVKYINNYEKAVVEYCKKRNCKIILCGHIHKAEDKVIEGVRYINTGDWVESNTFVIETLEGKLVLMKYEDIIRNSN